MRYKLAIFRWLYLANGEIYFSIWDTIDFWGTNSNNWCRKITWLILHYLYKPDSYKIKNWSICQNMSVVCLWKSERNLKFLSHPEANRRSNLSRVDAALGLSRLLAANPKFFNIYFYFWNTFLYRQDKSKFNPVI